MTNSEEAVGAWTELRAELQRVLTLDEEWCTEVGHSLTWWPSPLAVRVDAGHALDAATEDARLVQVSALVGQLPDDGLAEGLEYLAAWNSGRPGACAVLAGNDVMLTFATAYHAGSVIGGRHVVSSVARQSAYAIDLAMSLATRLALDPAAAAHPVSGLRMDIDEITGLYMDGAQDMFDVSAFFDADVLSGYEEHMLGQGLVRGWSNVEAVYFGEADNSDVSVGMGVQSGAESAHGSGVRYIGTTGLTLTRPNPGEVHELLNTVNLAVASVPIREGVALPHTTSAGAWPVDEEGTLVIALESFLPASAIAPFNREDLAPQARGGVLAHHALAVLDQAGYVNAAFSQL